VISWVSINIGQFKFEYLNDLEKGNRFHLLILGYEMIGPKKQIHFAILKQLVGMAVIVSYER